MYASNLNWVCFPIFFSCHIIFLQYLAGFRGDVIRLWLADWVPVPLVYTQVTLTCVRAFFLAALLGRQYLNVESTGGKIAPVWTSSVEFLSLKAEVFVVASKFRGEKPS